MVVVDVFGIPGVGKTTYVNKIQEKHTGKVYKREHIFTSIFWKNPMRKIFTLVMAARLYFKLRLYKYAIKDKLSTKNNYFKECVFLVLLVKFIELHKDTTHDSALILDHGFAQILIHLISTSKISTNQKLKLVDRIIDLIPKTEVIFVFIKKDDLELVAKRLKQRTQNNAWFDKENETFILSMLGSYAEVSAFLYEYLKKYKKPNFRFEYKHN